jgi:S1-C subfamily serine protease
MKNIRNLFRIGLLSFLMGCCSAGLTGVTVNTPQGKQEVKSKKQEEIEKLHHTTVAIINDSLDVNIPMCGAVWIAKNVLITAAHCVEDQITVKYSTFDDYNNDVVRTATIIGVDQVNDLALLHTQTHADHPVAILSSKLVTTGDEAHIVGHPVGYAWSYSHGYIATVRTNIKGPSGKIDKILQISAPVWMGNSGGGAFDTNGNLIGICSWVSKNGPHLAFFIHKEVIETFIAKHQKELL